MTGRQITIAGPPQRIQLRRKKGWRLPDRAVSVARPSRYGNPFAARPIPGTSRWTVVDLGDKSRTLREEPPDVHDKWAATVMAVRLFELHTGPFGLYEYEPGFLNPLTGRDLACYCPVDTDWPCHADSLLLCVNG